jgi:hypothetical protein
VGDQRLCSPGVAARLAGVAENLCARLNRTGRRSVNGLEGCISREPGLTGLVEPRPDASLYRCLAEGGDHPVRNARGDSDGRAGHRESSFAADTAPPGTGIPAGQKPAYRTGHGALPRRIHGKRRRAALLLENAQNALPPGLSIDSTTGQITGTPTTAGTFSFRARITDSDEA